MYDISIFMPSIRTNKLAKWYDTLCESCKKYKFQAVIVGPFDLPESLASFDNIKYLKSYSHPTKSAQIAASISDGGMIYHTTDDVHFYPNAIDQCLDYYHNECEKSDVILMRYIESENHSSQESYDNSYWSMANFMTSHGIKLSDNFPSDWIFNAQFMMRKDVFINFGGFDCQYEYLTHAAGDLLLRMQMTGIKVHNSPVDVSNADWYPGVSVDHAPIHYAQTSHDAPLFLNRILNNSLTSQIDFFNYLRYPEIWERRFDKNNLPNEYPC